MCGIVGIHGAQQPAWIEQMNLAIDHRGPDDQGYFRADDGRLALGMRRLSIVDLAGGHQPMTTPDGRFTIVFNGEIYNAPKLREDLKRRGIAFRSDHSDTEVLLHLFACRGQDALQALNGMFALAVYDRDLERLTLARDRFGIKPLYYADVAGRFVFASELKSILVLPFVDRQLDYQSLFHYMSLMYVPGPQSIVSSIRRLPPACVLTYDFGARQSRIERWWKPAFSEVDGISLADWRHRLRDGLEAAVHRWSLSDVPVGCSLSGGLDSSSIVGLLAKSGQKIRTYSLGFTGSGESDWNELPLARSVARKWGTDHHELVLEPEALLDDLVSMVWYLDEPYGGGLPSWTVFKFMSRDVKVGMTGTGGDELFGNYGKWRSLEGSWWRRLFGWPMTRQRFEADFFDRFYYLRDEDKRAQVFATSAHSSENSADVLYRYFSAAEANNPRNQVAHTDISTQLPDEFLMMTDRFSMAHSLEARTPFLDHEFAELALSVPAALRTRRRDLKGLLRDVVSELLPREVRNAPKKGFVIPLKLWLQGPLRPLVEALVNPARLESQGIFRPEFHKTFVRPHLDGSADHTQVVWAALMFQLWHQVFIERGAMERPTYDWKALAQ